MKDVEGDSPWTSISSRLALGKRIAINLVKTVAQGVLGTAGSFNSSTGPPHLHDDLVGSHSGHESRMCGQEAL